MSTLITRGEFVPLADGYDFVEIQLNGPLHITATTRTTLCGWWGRPGPGYRHQLVCRTCARSYLARTKERR